MGSPLPQRSSTGRSSSLHRGFRVPSPPPMNDVFASCPAPRVSGSCATPAIRLSSGRTRMRGRCDRQTTLMCGSVRARARRPVRHPRQSGCPRGGFERRGRCRSRCGKRVARCGRSALRAAWPHCTMRRGARRRRPLRGPSKRSRRRATRSAIRWRRWHARRCASDTRGPAARSTAWRRRRCSPRSSRGCRGECRR